MKNFCKMMGWIDAHNRINKTEIVLDVIIVVAVIGIAISMYDMFKG